MRNKQQRSTPFARHSRGRSLVTHEPEESRKRRKRVAIMALSAQYRVFAFAVCSFLPCLLALSIAYFIACFWPRCPRVSAWLHTALGLGNTRRTRQGHHCRHALPGKLVDQAQAVLAH